MGGAAIVAVARPDVAAWGHAASPGRCLPVGEGTLRELGPHGRAGFAALRLVRRFVLARVGARQTVA